MTGSTNTLGEQVARLTYAIDRLTKLLVQRDAITNLERRELINPLYAED